MHYKEVQAISKQLRPVATKLQSLFSLTGVPNGTDRFGSWNDTSPGYIRDENAFTFGKLKDGTPILKFKNLRPYGNSWIRTIGDTKESNIETIEACRKVWRNDTRSAIEVELDEEVTIEDGLQSVNSKDSFWEVGAELSTSLEVEASAGTNIGAVEASASVTASVEASVSASGGQSFSNENTTNTTKTKTKTISQSFTVQPNRELNVVAVYDQSTLDIAYTDLLDIDFELEICCMYSGGKKYNTYYTFGMGLYKSKMVNGKRDGKVRCDSFRRWLSGYFGVSHYAFQPGLDITFSDEREHMRAKEMINEIREDLMKIKRSGSIIVADSSSIRFNLQGKELD